MIGALRGGVDAFLAGHALGAEQAARVDEVLRVAGASYHVVQLRGSEQPHRHVDHDLAIRVLRGQGTLTLAAERIPLGPGDAAVIPRGAVHWFAPAGGDAAALVAFTPPLDAPDYVPAPIDSPSGGS